MTGRRLRTPAGVVVLLVAGVGAVRGQGQPPLPIDWVRVTDHAAWQPRDSCGEAVFRDRLWLLGGWFDSFHEPPRDVWSSADGIHWDRVVEQAPWKHSDLPTTLAFNNRLWIMGGWHNGRLSDASASNQVWASGDGTDWQCVTPAAEWSPRLGAAGTVFQDKMWIVGGVRRYYDGTAEDLLSDVWCSADGEHWQCVTPRAPWPGRAYHAVLVLGGKLWLLGGGNYQPGYLALNDVWSSPDGEHWTQELAQAPWPPRIWFSGEVYRDRLWVLGGWSNNPFQNHADIWHSADGRTWERLDTPTAWAARHEHSAYVLDDALWIAGGHAMPLANDVWRLKLPSDWPAPPKTSDE